MPRQLTLMRNHSRLDTYNTSPNSGRSRHPNSRKHGERNDANGLDGKIWDFCFGSYFGHRNQRLRWRREQHTSTSGTLDLEYQQLDYPNESSELVHRN